MGGATDTEDGGENGGEDGGANGGVSVSAVAVSFPADMDLSPSFKAIESLISFVDSSSFPDQIDTTSLLDIENNLIHSLFFSPDPFAFKAFSPPLFKIFRFVQTTFVLY